MNSIDNAISKLYSIRVVGVNNHQKFLPYNFSTGTFPMLFIRNMQFDLEFGSNLSNEVNLSTGQAEIVIVVEAFKQGSSVQNYEKSRQLISSLADAIISSPLLLSSEGVSIKEDFELTGDTVLFVVIATCNFYL